MTSPGWLQTYLWGDPLAEIWSAALTGVTPVAISVIVFARHRLHAAVVVLLMGVCWTIIILTSTWENPNVGRATDLMVLVLPVILLSVAPAKAISRRLIFLALGLLLLIALNELSKLGLDVTAPKQG
jgi:hypothetical protein